MILFTLRKLNMKQVENSPKKFKKRSITSIIKKMQERETNLLVKLLQC